MQTDRTDAVRAAITADSHVLMATLHGCIQSSVSRQRVVCIQRRLFHTIASLTQPCMHHASSTKLQRYFMMGSSSAA